MDKVYVYFDVECRKVKADSVKRMYGISAHRKNERFLSREPTSLVVDFMNEQNRLKKEVETLSACSKRCRNKCVEGCFS